MVYRNLGRTGVCVGIVGLGMEYLESAPKETVSSVVRTALDNGIDYFDLWMATPGVRDAMGEAIKGRRDEAFIAGHIGAVLVDNKTDRSRDPSVAGRNFNDLLIRLGTDHWEAETYAKAAATKEIAVQTKRELYAECARSGVAIVAMKPFAAGWLFRKDNPSSIILSPVQCLNYSLSQPGVAVAVPGCKDVDELKGCLSYLQANEKDRDFSSIASNDLWKLQGKCMYCDHCLPCPSGIAVGRITRLLDSAKSGRAVILRVEYLSLERGAEECIECGDCMKRCPFGVNVVANMREARRIFA